VSKNIVNRQSLTEQIKTILIERILDGKLLPGDRLKELRIAEEFGTSQAPVREALRSLQALGYLEHKAHVGAVVRTYAKKEIEEAYQIREALEAHSLIMTDLDSPEFAEQLNLQLGKMHEAVKSGNVRAFTDADNRFHRAIIKCSGNNRMLEMWDSLRMQLQVLATVMETHMPLAEIYELHPPIVMALERQHREGSARFLANHYQQVGNYWKKLR